MIDKELLKDYLESACEVHGKPYSEALLKGWIGCTNSVSEKQFEEAFWSCATDRFPKPSDLLQAVAGINPTDDWEKIMAVATGRTETITISGYAAASLRQIGGVRSLANADEIGTRVLHKQFLEGIQTAGSGLPAAAEEISLMPIRPKTVVEDHLYPVDITGEIRATALIKTLHRGTVSPKTAKMIVSSSKKIGLGDAVSSWPAAQRDRVLAIIAEMENPELQTEPKLATVLTFSRPTAAAH
jgi:hypothetical protein